MNLNYPRWLARDQKPESLAGYTTRLFGSCFKVQEYSAMTRRRGQRKRAWDWENRRGGIRPRQLRDVALHRFCASARRQRSPTRTGWV